MKQNKCGLLFSILFTAISIIVYLCSQLNCFNGNFILADICAAVFSSSVFVVILSTIGYMVEKKRQRNLILDSCFVNWLDIDVVIENGILKLGVQELKSLFNTLLNSIIVLKKNLQDYYKGLIFRDNILKTLINEKLYGLYKSVNEFLVYIVYPNCKNNIVNIQFKKLMSEHREMLDAIIDWMKNKRFELGKEFDFGENFVENYEKATLDLNKE